MGLGVLSSASWRLWTGLCCLEDLWPNATWTGVLWLQRKTGRGSSRGKQWSMTASRQWPGLLGAIKHPHGGWVWGKQLVVWAA